MGAWGITQLDHRDQVERSVGVTVDPGSSEVVPSNVAPGPAFAAVSRSGGGTVVGRG